MKLTRTVALAVFAALKFKTADKWNETRMNDKLDKIGDNVTAAEVEAIADPVIKETVENIIKANTAKETVEIDVPAAAPRSREKEPAAPRVTADDKAEPPDEPAKGKKKDAGKTAEAAVKASDKKVPLVKVKAAPAAKKSEVALDRFGQRVGSQAAAINEVMSKKWQTLEEIMKGSKLGKPRVTMHMRYLVDERKFVEASDKGYRLNDKGAAQK